MGCSEHVTKWRTPEYPVMSVGITDVVGEIREPSGNQFERQRLDKYRDTTDEPVRHIGRIDARDVNGFAHEVSEKKQVLQSICVCPCSDLQELTVSLRGDHRRN
jgi:hypothetical protein